MSRTTLAALTVIVGVAVALTAGAGAATNPRWTIADLGTFGARWTSGSAAAVNAVSGPSWSSRWSAMPIPP